MSEKKTKKDRDKKAEEAKRKKERFRVYTEIVESGRIVHSEDILRWFQLGVPLQTAVLMLLVTETHKDRECWLSPRGIAKRFDMPVRAVTQAIQRLKSAGLVSRTGEKGNRKRKWILPGRVLPTGGTDAEESLSERPASEVDLFQKDSYISSEKTHESFSKRLPQECKSTEESPENCVLVYTGPTQPATEPPEGSPAKATGEAPDEPQGAPVAPSGSSEPSAHKPYDGYIKEGFKERPVADSQAIETRLVGRWTKALADRFPDEAPVFHADDAHIVVREILVDKFLRTLDLKEVLQFVDNLVAKYASTVDKVWPGGFHVSYLVRSKKGTRGYISKFLRDCRRNGVKPHAAPRAGAPAPSAPSACRGEGVAEPPGKPRKPRPPPAPAPAPTPEPVPKPPPEPEPPRDWIRKRLQSVFPDAAHADSASPGTVSQELLSEGVVLAGEWLAAVGGEALAERTLRRGLDHAAGRCMRYPDGGHESHLKLIHRQTLGSQVAGTEGAAFSDFGERFADYWRRAGCRDQPHDADEKGCGDAVRLFLRGLRENPPGCAGGARKAEAA